MSERDALRDMDKFDRMTGSGLFIKFRADVPLVLRILTTDPVLSETEFTDRQTGEITLSTRFAFIVYNFTEEKAQILQVSPAMARRIGEIHSDEDFGANIRSVDLKITPTGERLDRRYDIQVLPKTRTLTRDMIEEAQKIDLDKSVKDSRGRMSKYDTELGAGMNRPMVGRSGSSTFDYDGAKERTYSVGREAAPVEQDDMPPAKPDTVIDDFDTEEPMNLDNIPF